MSNTAKLLGAFEQGKEFTAKQISASFKLKNPAEAIRTLRNQGYAIYSNEKTLSNGTKAVKYRLGVPSRRMVAAAAQLAGASVFSRASA